MSLYLAELRSSVTTVDGFSNINWKDVAAVRALNKALLKEDWKLEVDMKEDRLCPPVCRYAHLRLTIDT